MRARRVNTGTGTVVNTGTGTVPPSYVRMGGNGACPDVHDKFAACNLSFSM